MTVNSWRGLSILLGLVLLLSQAAHAQSGALSYDRDVRPILAEYCFACHGFDEATREADLRLDTRQGALDSGSGGAVVPGDPDSSLLIERISSDDDDLVMPPVHGGKTLSDKQKQLLREWIKQGADYELHWAFQPPPKVEPPRASSNQHPIDAFVQAKLQEQGLQPSPLAKPEVLLRRLSLDLIGLPPTIAELDQFVEQAQSDPNAAYDAAVERLLASPHYGERFGRWWLDQARYADSNGYSIDAPRQIWLYRDWVVNALNNDMPFDQFTIEQIAGDMLPNATQDQRIATGFHRNTQINQEGGVDPEQFRIESVFDRVATTGIVWLGLTVNCAQCHNHKFDPISQKEYYQLFAFLNNQDEPELKFPEKGEPVEQSTETDDSTDSAAKSDKPKKPKMLSTMVMKERDKPRETFVYIKGDFTRPADQVFPGTPAVLHSMKLAESNGQGEQPNSSRLDLARWLVDRENPLTARVIVNRVWQHYFGSGLVVSDNDFGLQGMPPSHPELLDWLAVEFMDSGWSLKQLSRLIVSSQTYQQSSKRNPDLDERDPYNNLLARQQRLRLEAEIVRDIALTASGLLVDKMGGPPVYPPIPDGVMNLGQVKRDWKTSEGDDRYRRGLYTFVFRATPPPSLNVFDAPDGFSTCTRRIRSNTPLQALTLMNDSGFFEFAEALERVVQEQGLEVAFRRCTSRWPTESELAVLQRLDTLNAARALLNLDETISRE